VNAGAPQCCHATADSSTDQTPDVVMGPGHVSVCHHTHQASVLRPAPSADLADAAEAG
jgi:hypothetical protein